MPRHLFFCLCVFRTFGGPSCAHRVCRGFEIRELSSGGAPGEARAPAAGPAALQVQMELGAPGHSRPSSGGSRRLSGVGSSASACLTHPEPQSALSRPVIGGNTSWSGREAVGPQTTVVSAQRGSQWLRVWGSALSPEAFSPRRNCRDQQPGLPGTRVHSSPLRARENCL